MAAYGDDRQPRGEKAFRGGLVSQDPNDEPASVLLVGSGRNAPLDQARRRCRRRKIKTRCYCNASRSFFQTPLFRRSIRSNNISRALPLSE